MIPTVATSRRVSLRRLGTGLSFLAPNIIGFVGFTMIPLIISFVMAFTNWDLRLHNQFRSEPLRFIGFDNFIRLFTEPDLWRFFGNTLFLMIGVPFSIAGSLMLALLLSRDPKGNRAGRIRLAALAGGVLIVATIITVAVGLNASATSLLLTTIGGAVLLGGMAGGSTLYRTLFYLPNFTAGVATILLWKNLFNPSIGPINAILQPPLDLLTHAVRVAPSPLIDVLPWMAFTGIVVVLLFGLRQLQRMWINGELGSRAAIAPLVLLLLPLLLCFRWLPSVIPAIVMTVIILAMLVVNLKSLQSRSYACRTDEGLGSALMLCGSLMILAFIALGLGILALRLPAMASSGLRAPGWYTSYTWAKPSMMVIGFWAAIGSNNMLLYLAGLSGIPVEQYEAADLDGATAWQRFWNVTWPHLAPTTFFIVVMSIIGGLQGGFEIARAMTAGGPDGATTTLSYFIYTEGFETGRLGYSSAVAWILFLMVLAITLFNWKFGNRYVND